MNVEFKIALALFAFAAIGLLAVFFRARSLSPNGAHPVTMVVTNVSAILALAGIVLAFLAINAMS